ncbi:MAG: Rpn family recombination-promoting nuclease/putative transposase [Spirochaetales bacterium]|nr:Rpn family recombination-promoting nuclease/putative transposase [Spirochaetales bacterium]
MARALNPLSDIFIRYLLGSESNKDLLKDFINAVFEEKGFPHVEELEIQNPFNIKSSPLDKESILDVKAKDSSGRIINVEVQVSKEESFAERSLYYWALNYQKQLNEGEIYGELEPTVCINLLDFLIFPELEDFHTCFQITEKNQAEYILSEHLQIHFVELSKLKNLKNDDVTDQLLGWCYYFKNEGNIEETNMPVLLKKDKNFKKAHEEYKRFTADDALMDAIEAREKWRKDYNSRMATAEKLGREKGLIEGREEGREEGLQEGREEGREEGRQEGRDAEKHAIAQMMLKEKISPKVISNVTGLTPQEIDTL